MKKIVKKLYQHLKFRKYRSIYFNFKEYTMVPQSLFYANRNLCEKYSAISGPIVECGTWKGGMIAGIASLLGPERDYFLFDSFEGLPPAKEIDGESALN